MNRRVGRYVFGGVALYALFLVITVPAELFAWALARATNNAITLQTVSGTAWRGGGELVFTRPQAPSLNLGSGNWALNPLWLAIGRLGIAIDFRNVDNVLQAKARVGWSGGTISDVDLRFPAQLIQTVYPPASLAGLSGDIRITATEFEVARRAMDGQITAIWTNASTAVSAVRPLGDFRLVATGQGAAVALSLATVRGDVNLAGEGAWTASTRRLQMNGTVAPTPSSKVALDPLLRLFGRDHGSGRRVFMIDVSV